MTTKSSKALIGRLQRSWTKRSYFNTAWLGLGSTAGLMCLYNSGNQVLATTLTVLGLGSVYLHWRNAARAIIRSNHAVVVTGCDSGLGYSLALHCRSLDAAVIAGVLEPDGLGAQDLIKNGVNVIPLDVTRSDSIAKFGSEVRGLIARKNLDLRALVNNAGVMIFGEFEWQTEEQTRRQVEVNFLGTMSVTRELMPTVRSTGSRIIVVSSHCSSQPLPGVATYAATKAAISAWATALRIEVSKYGVEVVCFVPGSFTGESNLLARQDAHFAVMASAMTREAKNFYGSYFSRYRKYLSGISREMVAHKLENALIYEAFNGALMDVYPRTVYKCEPWRYTLYHLLFKTTPTCISDRLVEKFVAMPRWMPNADIYPAGDSEEPESSEFCSSPELKISNPSEQDSAKPVLADDEITAQDIGSNDPSVKDDTSNR